MSDTVNSEVTERLKKSLDLYERALLHLDDPGNKHVDLGADECGVPKNKDLYVLSDGQERFSYRMFQKIKEMIGQGPSVVVKDSALMQQEQDFADPTFLRCDFVGSVPKSAERSVQKQFAKFVEDCYKDVREKGNNPMFLTLGAIRWKIHRNVHGSPESVMITSPLLIFPIKLIRGADQSVPVKIEFTDDEIFVNESFYRLFSEMNPSQMDRFPLPEGYVRELGDISTFDLPKYFAQVAGYVADHQPKGGATVFEFLPDFVAVSKYTHDDICMYRDIRRNEEKILESPLIRKVFAGENSENDFSGMGTEPRFVLRYDSVQKEIADRVIAKGECVKVQGPPGTGKTQTIANMIASALYAQKRVLFVSRKTPALEEVFDKLPKQISRFALLIKEDSETASAKMNKNDVQQDLRDTLRYSLDNVNKNQVKGSDEALRTYVKEDIVKLNTYKRLMFNDVLKNGYSFYDAIVNVMKAPEAPAVPFDAPSPAFLLKADTASFVRMDSIVDNAAKTLLTATRNYAFLPSHSPHFGVREEKTHQTFVFDKGLYVKVYNVLAELVKKFPEAEGFSLYDYECVSRIEFDEATVAKYLTLSDLELLAKRLQEAVTVIKQLEEKGYYKRYASLFEDSFFERFIAPPIFSADSAFDDLALSSLEEILSSFDDHVINRVRRNKKKVLELMASYNAECETIRTLEPIFLELYGEDVFADPKKMETFADLGKKLEKFFGKEIDTIPALAFGAKSAYKKLLDLLPRYAPIKFSRITEVMQAFMGIVKAKENISAILSELSVTVELTFEEKDLPKLFALLGLNEKGVIFEDAVDECRKIRAFVKDTFEPNDHYFVRSLLAHGTVAEVKELLAVADVYREYVKAAIACNVVAAEADLTILDEKGHPTLKEIESIFYGICGISLLKNVKDKMPLIKELAAVKNEITEVINSLLAYASEYLDKKYLSVSIYGDLKKVRADDLLLFAEHANDETMKNAMFDYHTLLKGWRDQSLEFFFRPFETGAVKYDGKYSFNEIFFHSFYALVVSAIEKISEKKTELFGLVSKIPSGTGEACGRKHYAEADAMFGLGRGEISAEAKEDIMHDLRVIYDTYASFKNTYSDRRLFEIVNDFKTHEYGMLANNRDLIALSEIDRITKLKEKYAFNVFEANKSAYKNTRLLFKHEAARILALKRCFIMSPATVSTFLYGDQYADFDLVIFDEASQIEPQHLIPALFRAKQCVVIGDEYQMPPMRYFVNQGGGKDPDEDERFEKVASALDLMNQPGNKMANFVLRCHYRSNSESLIAYSQRYYPEMLTFPSVFSYSKTLGVRDLYVPNGVGVGGVNEEEAMTVIKVLERHLEETPDATVGVMTFGVAQADRINALLLSMPKLRSELIEKYGEEGFFVKPIDKLQGREVDHVVMSMTYSRNARGSFGSFGSLDRSNCGENVFNVAASRAKNMLTVIHSYTAEEIAASNKQSAGYLSDFLRIVREQSAKDGAEEGIIRSEVGEISANYFVQDVKKFIVENCGIAPSRILLNYGVTEKSLRIPIVILDEAGTKGKLAIFCEDKPIVAKKEVSYVDYAIRYKESLIQDRGWGEDHSIRVFAYDWLHYEKEREILKDFVNNNK